MLNGIEKVKIWKSVCEKVFFLRITGEFDVFKCKKSFPLVSFISM